MQNNQIIANVLLLTWFRLTYGRELTIQDLERAEAWHLKNHLGWDIWTNPDDHAVAGEAALSTEQWITALEEVMK